MDLYGVIGWPIEHSLSPAMHNAAFKALDIEATYEKIPVKPEDLEDFLLTRQEVKGFNITIPHKVRAKKILERIGKTDSDFADLCGAINAARRGGSEIYYTNTDAPGFLASLKEDLNFDPKDKNILLIGCGGAGRAIIAGLVGGDKSCARIYAYDENEAVAESCRNVFLRFKQLKIIPHGEMNKIVADCQLLVNATPIGMKEGDAAAADKDILHKDLSVYDVVYNRDTELVKLARSRGSKAVNGLGMLLYQGVMSLEFWLDSSVPQDVIDVMRNALNNALP
ncbi:MAG: shikimate dehydrogenase [Candidatus Omnitrophica bacterium]|nr:shikimate dehydrogenase [Candidatus Omnitrophota bacterium]